MSKCVSCPYNDGITKEATDAQNWGCLPDNVELRRISKEGRVWMCHSNEQRQCSGFIEEYPEAGSGNPLTYLNWFHGKEYTHG